MMSFDYASTHQEYEMAIDCGNDVNEEDYDGCTPLFHVSAFNMNDYFIEYDKICLLYTSPSPRDLSTSRMPSSA